MANSNIDQEPEGSHFASATQMPANDSDLSCSPETGTRIYSGDAGAHRRRHGLVKRIAVAVVAVVVVLLAGTGVAAALWVGSINESLALEDEEEMEELEAVLTQVEDSDASENVITDAEQEEEPFYVLLLGSDARSSETSRSDVIMLARVDPATATVTVISIPRDTMVDIDGYGTQKINAAYAYGGAALTVEVVEEYAGVDISHYAEIHFDEFEELIDSLGGIEVDVPEDVSVDGVTVEAGEQTLTGEEALAVARDRHHVTGGDFGRNQAQRIIVEAVLEKVLSVSAAELPEVVENIAECITTDYSVSELLELAIDFYGQDLTFYSASCPSYTYSSGGVSYVATMYDEWREMMQRVDAGLDPEDEDAEIPEEQLENERLGSAENGAGPEDYEYLAASSSTTDDVADIDDDEDSDEGTDSDEGSAAEDA